MQNIKSRISKEHLFPIIVIVIFVLLVLFKINGSSIAVFNQVFFGDYQDKNLLLCQPRWIRSDEFQVSTLWAVSEDKANYSLINSLYLPEQILITSDVPARHWSMFFEPYNWGFFVLDIERAVSYRWWFRSVLFILASYFGSLLLTNQNRIASVLASLGFWLSPFFQWWYSSMAIDNVAFGIIIFLFFLRMLQAETKRKMIMNSIGFTYFSICFALAIYPPFQIVVVQFFVLLGLLIYLKKKDSIRRENKRFLFAVVFLSLVILLLALFAYYFSIKDVFTVVSNSVYPGSRTSSGGGVNLKLLLSSFFYGQLLDERISIPSFLGNASEGAGFFFFSVFLLPIIAFLEIKKAVLKKEVDWMIIFMVVYQLLIFCWAFVGLPEFLSKILFLSFVPGIRSLLVLGLMNFFIILYFLYQTKFNIDHNYKIVAGIYLIGVFVFVTLFGFYLKNNYPGFISNNYKILFITMSVALLTFCLLFKQDLLFLIFLLLFSIFTTGSVNPLYKGLGPAVNSTVSNDIQEVLEQYSNGESWVIYDDILLGEFFAAQGAKVISGTHYYADMDFWEQLDTEGEYADFYNRYSHVTFIDNPDQDLFILNTPDHFSVNINPCDEFFTNNDIRFFVFKSPVKYECLIELKRLDYPNLDLYIYENK